jgi:hypothetical protein
VNDDDALDLQERKPRCRSCPHAVAWGTDEFCCELNPSRFVGVPTMDGPKFRNYEWMQPIMNGSEGCSHHPDFPDWLVEWKKGRDGQGVGKPPETAPEST